MSAEKSRSLHSVVWVLILKFSFFVSAFNPDLEHLHKDKLGQYKGVNSIVLYSLFYYISVCRLLHVFRWSFTFVSLEFSSTKEAVSSAASPNFPFIWLSVVKVTDKVSVLPGKSWYSVFQCEFPQTSTVWWRICFLRPPVNFILIIPLSSHLISAVCVCVFVPLHVFVPALLALIFPTWFHFMPVCACAYTVYHVALGVCPSLSECVCALAVHSHTYFFYVCWHIWKKLCLCLSILSGLCDTLS